MQISHTDLEKEMGPIYLPYVVKRDFHERSFTDTVIAVAQSNRSFLLDGLFELSISVLEHVSGGSRPRTPRTRKDGRRTSKSLVHVLSFGNDCGHRALYMAYFHLNPFHDKKSGNG